MSGLFALIRRLFHCLFRLHRGVTLYGNWNGPSNRSHVHITWIGCECGRTFWGEAGYGKSIAQMKKEIGLED